jgi:hypothetical protein
MTGISDLPIHVPRVTALIAFLRAPLEPLPARAGVSGSTACRFVSLFGLTPGASGALS